MATKVQAAIRRAYHMHPDSVHLSLHPAIIGETGPPGVPAGVKAAIINLH